MRRHSPLLAVVLVSTGFMGCSPSGLQEQPSVTFGASKIYLGMTREEVQRRLAESARHIVVQSDLPTGDQHLSLTTVARNSTADPNDSEGVIIFRDDRVISAELPMPAPQNADVLAGEIANAVDGMQVKTCVAENSRNASTSTPVQETRLWTRFRCGSQYLSIRTSRISSPIQHVTTTVSAGIAQPPVK
jgi:hypothetical protein